MFSKNNVGNFMGVVLISGKIFPNAIFGVRNTFLLFVLILWSKGQVACLNEIGGMHIF